MSFYDNNDSSSKTEPPLGSGSSTTAAGAAQSGLAASKVLEVGVLVWSVATALVPFLAGYLPGLLLTRILVGIGEGVSPSAATDLIARCKHEGVMLNCSVD
ncbi:hypothetical protein P8452_14377 [Trifolium repens]|nr:hypothetical protein P8452_14377 [Trifolium repens]